VSAEYIMRPFGLFLVTLSVRLDALENGGFTYSATRLVRARDPDEAVERAESIVAGSRAVRLERLPGRVSG